MIKSSLAKALMATAVLIASAVAHGQTPINVALAANGGVATASSVFPWVYHSTAATIDGDRNGIGVRSWASATPTFPQWLQVNFSASRRIDEIDVFSPQDNYTAPLTPTPTMTFANDGLSGFLVQTWNGSAWVTIPGGNVTGNNLVWRKFTFPPIVTDRIRITTTASPKGYSRLVEVEAWTANPANIPPTVSLTEPADGTVVTAPASLTLTAAASDSDGSIARVDFYRGTTLIGTTTASPYSVSDANLAIGSYSYTAVATDNAGATTTSTPVTVKVLNVGAVGTTTYQYDPNGNLTRITDPLGNARQSSYDALERLIQITDPAAGVAKLAYDGRDQLTKATDPRNLATTYQVDGLGNASQQVSPDSGVTTQSFDAAGNPLTRSDARQQSAQTRYDALDRPIQIDYSDGRQTRYVWDLGQNGIGRLGRIEDYANGTLVSRLAYAYDAQGRLVRQEQTVGALSQSVASTYTEGRLAALTLPSGRTLAYRHDGAGRIADITLATPGLPLVQNAAHTADGRLQRWTDAAGKVQTRNHNLDGQVVAYSAGGQTWQLTYDSAGRLTRIADSANPVLAADYGYDALNRITRAVLPNTAYSYAYDANGNRKQSTLGGQVQTLSIDPASNRLLALAGSPPIAYTYDPAGNRSTDGQTNYTYDAAGRLVQATGANGSTRYEVNALNQRTRKTGPLGDTTYLHDRQGHLLAETDNQGRIQREYVWLDDQLLAILDGEPSATQVYAVHPDPLGTPRAVTDPTGKLLWRAAPASEPFGLSVEQDPDGDGTPFVLNLRFPGQYYDQETNLAYNWHRYYDERVGSYTTSDPIGLNGGQWSTYGYVNGNPIKYADPMGLEKTLRDMLGPDSMDTPPPPDYPTTDRRPAPPPPPPPPSVPNPDPWPGPDDPKGQCIRLYDKCINQGWKGNCDACVKKCIAQEEWPFRGPVSCRPKNNQCPAL
jgi:RHS repeat-associated protein